MCITTLWSCIISNRFKTFHSLAEDGKILKFRQSKGDNSSIIDGTLIKLYVHNHTIVLYIQYKFHKIPFIGYLVMAVDGKNIGIKAIKGQ